jgi:glycosyltransferase involved in cell wall biosynthesis
MSMSGLRRDLRARSKAVMVTPPDYSVPVEARGKFLYLGQEKFWVKGVTYGSFKPGPEGVQFPEPNIVRSDFEAIAAAGMNTVRTYTAPPAWLLDLALEQGLRVMVGLAWEQHVAFLDDRLLVKDIERRVRESVRACNRHPAILCYALGNEIPASIVRWHGRVRIERFLKRLYRIAKAESPEALFTYVNYPTTEYLQLQFFDLCCFNLYLESEDTLSAYLSKLQNLAGGKPLLMTEIGLDSLRNGLQEQASQLKNQIRTIFAAGCAGSVVFAWTDEWHRGGVEITDWNFGLCDRQRRPKPALAAVSGAYGQVPFPSDFPWPRVSVVVCSYNGSKTIRDTMAALQSLDYPDFEVIVVDDGSADETAAIAEEAGFRVIRTTNRGLGEARNTGWRVSRGDIIAFVDDDAYPDRHWLQYLAYVLATEGFAAVGGVSPAPTGGGLIADCVASAPGRPVHVLLTNTEAEHIPGCNMAFRRTALEDIGGFDTRYRQAGDDVDVCWRILERGERIGFHAGAVTWHHCRNSLAAYWKQQKGYGKAEALLEEKWPDRYNPAGHLTWRGSIYGNVYSNLIPLSRGRIYQGQWGSAPFQSIYQPGQQGLSALPLMPEWLFVVALLACLSILGIAWPPMLMAVPLLGVALVLPVIQAGTSSRSAQPPARPLNRRERIALRCGTAFLYLIQPLARLAGRLQHGLTPWRRRIANGMPLSGTLNRSLSVWSEQWQPSCEWLGSLEGALLSRSIPVRRGNEFHSWDLEIHGGLFASARLLMAAEDHERGKQFLRFRLRSRMAGWALALMLVFFALGIAAMTDRAPLVAGVLLAAAAGIWYRSRHEALTAENAFEEAIDGLQRGTQGSQEV